MDWQVVSAYIDHFLPRDVIGPVLIVFSLEGVIDGIFSLYVPERQATLGWGLVFLASIVVVAYWGAKDEEDLEELSERVGDLEGGSTGSEER